MAGSITLPTGETVFTGRITPRTHPWLNQHTILGTSIAPATTLLDLTLHTAATLNCPHLTELTIETPLPVPKDGAVRVQVTVTAPDESGRRQVTVHTGDPQERTLVRTAHAVVGPGTGTPRVESCVPPADALPLDLDDAYARLAEHGYEYGPAFRGLTAAWRHGDDIYAEATLPGTDTDTDYAIHPALLDAALHPIALAQLDSTQPDRIPILSSWRDVTLTGHRANVLRARIRRDGAAYTVTISDGDGLPVASVGRVEVDTVAHDRLAALAPPQPLRIVEWRPLTEPTGPLPPVTAIAVGTSPVDGLADVPGLDGLFALPTLPQAVVHSVPVPADGDDPASDADAIAEQTLPVVQRFLADDRLADVPLVVITNGATTGALAAASVWGRLCSAQAEHPGRLILADLTGGDALTPELLAACLAAGHFRYVISEEGLHTPHLVPAPGPAAPAPVWDPDGTVLVTGGGTPVGTLVADHLVTRYGVRHVLLTKQTDSEALAAELAAVPAQHPVTAVVHTTQASSTAWHLDRLTTDQPLAAFVLFSPYIGSGALTFMEGLAAHRQARGLPATAVAWGPWAEDAGGAEHRTDAGRSTWRIPMPTSAALDLLDRALAGHHPAVVAAHLIGGMPPARSARPVAARYDLRQELAGRSPDERQGVVLVMVRQAIADVLGYPSHESIAADQPFQALGISSLTATELRDRLARAAGVPLPATLVYDHPTPTTLAEYICDRVAPTAAAATQLLDDELARLEGTLADVSEPESRAWLARRLKELAARIGTELPAGKPESDDLDSVSDEEIFAIIDNDF
ncbi:polyketide synthase dehydratase domain-containing protein [Micromonospora sp. RP3T]|uniref:polyketide synthase dehydratase domain-containing protein n=1 Tax=Micromonospora sp. RP3T TaxID=2135446 RepID=UPI0021040280|nr:polyketide synthase dehydratase domain-containing protein [Micromonospora sp. RP3T]